MLFGLNTVYGVKTKLVCIIYGANDFSVKNLAQIKYLVNAKEAKSTLSKSETVREDL